MTLPLQKVYVLTQWLDLCKKCMCRLKDSSSAKCVCPDSMILRLQKVYVQTQWFFLCKKCKHRLKRFFLCKKCRCGLNDFSSAKSVRADSVILPLSWWFKQYPNQTRGTVRGVWPTGQKVKTQTEAWSALYTHRCVSLLGPKLSFISLCRWMARWGMRRMGRARLTRRWVRLPPSCNACNTHQSSSKLLTPRNR